LGSLTAPLYHVTRDVIPAKGVIQFQATRAARGQNWIPAFAGMTPW
jgi:hypothetical protein